MRAFIVIPTYNEAENISILVEKILNLRLKYSKIIIIDDNSPDGTGKVADSLVKKHKGKLFVVHREGKLGLGSAYKRGFKEAINKKAEVVVTMDADLSHDPKDIPKMLKILRDKDVVIGSRFIDGGGIVGFTIWRRLLSGAAQGLCRFFLRLKVYDSTSGFRAYKTKVLNNIKVSKIKSEGYSYLIEAIIRCQKKDFKIAEIPIIYLNRTRGKSKISEAEIFKAVLTVIRLKIEQLSRVIS